MGQSLAATDAPLGSRESGIAPVRGEPLERRIFILRGRRVMIDSDLARIYGVTTMRLNEQVKRNLKRFPSDFVFKLNPEEHSNLISQIAISRSSWGGRRKPPYAFTEHGAVMLASVLNSPTAVRASIEVVRAFLRLREMIATHADLARRLDDLEKKYDSRFLVVFRAIREIIEPGEDPPHERIGFHRK